jgi:hypothetical protein
MKAPDYRAAPDLRAQKRPVRDLDELLFRQIRDCRCLVRRATREERRREKEQSDDSRRGHRMNVATRRSISPGRPAKSDDFGLGAAHRLVVGFFARLQSLDRLLRSSPRPGRADQAAERATQEMERHQGRGADQEDDILRSHRHPVAEPYRDAVSRAFRRRLAGTLSLQFFYASRSAVGAAARARQGGLSRAPSRQVGYDE